MKFAFLALALVSFSAFAKVELSNLVEKKEFDQYFISSDKAATVTVNVDVEVRRVDCHGLGQKYTKEVLSTGEVLITKQFLAHTMMMCPPGTDRVETAGISFQVPFKKSFGGSQVVLVPSDAKVTVESK